MAYNLEKSLEEYYLYALASTTYKDICQSEEGVKNCRCILQLIKGWDKALLPEDRNHFYTFANIDDSISAVKTYILNKYSGVKKQHYETLLSSPDFCQDLRNLFIRKIYEHKYQLEQTGFKSFQSTLARRQTILYYLNKTQTKIIYEAVGSSIKKATSLKIDEAAADLIIEQIHHEIMLLNARYIGTRPLASPSKKLPQSTPIQGILFVN